MVAIDEDCLVFLEEGFGGESCNCIFPFCTLHVFNYKLTSCCNMLNIIILHNAKNEKETITILHLWLPFISRVLTPYFERHKIQCAWFISKNTLRLSCSSLCYVSRFGGERRNTRVGQAVFKFTIRATVSKTFMLYRTDWLKWNDRLASGISQQRLSYKLRLRRLAKWRATKKNLPDMAFWSLRAIRGSMTSLSSQISLRETRQSWPAPLLRPPNITPPGLC